MLEIAYILLSIIMLLIVTFGYYQSLRKFYPDNKKDALIKLRNFIIFILVWGGYTIFLTETELLKDLSLPPKFPLFMFLPLLIFTIAFYRLNRNNAFIQSIPKTWTTYLQSFRIFVEILLLYTFKKHIIPIEATFEGYNFDILMGILAIPVGYFFLKNVAKYKTILYIWNMVGISMVLFVAFIIGSSMYFPAIWGYSSAQVNFQFLEYPYFLIPSFLAPLAIFMHVVSLIQLRSNKE